MSANEKAKDFFISYNKADFRCASRLAKWLKDAGYSYIMQSSHFAAGSNFVLEMDKAVRSSKHTIALLSPDYLGGEFTQAEWAAAFAGDPTGAAGGLIPVRVRECKPTGLLAQIVYIDLVGLPAGQAKARFFDRIKESSLDGRVEDPVGDPRVVTGGNRKTPNHEDLDENDKKAMLQDWFRARSASKKKERIIIFSEVDDEIGFPQGTAKRYLREVATARHYDVETEGKKTILFRKRRLNLSELQHQERLRRQGAWPIGQP